MENNTPNPYFNQSNPTPPGRGKLPVWLTVIIAIVLVFCVGSCTMCVSCAACIACNAPEIVDELEQYEYEFDEQFNDYEYDFEIVE